jgi:hypothetical protein
MGEDVEDFNPIINVLKQNAGCLNQLYGHESIVFSQKSGKVFKNIAFNELA